MVLDELTAKRRKVAASADAIAQSNATMNLFTGQAGRQNRWMTWNGSDANGTEGSGSVLARQSGAGAAAAQTGAPRNSASGEAARPPQNTVNPPGADERDLFEHIFRSTGVPEETVPVETNWGSLASDWGAADKSATMPPGTTADGAIVIDYDSAYTPVQTASKSREASATRQGLPSPAPSEEFQSPLMASAAPPPDRILESQSGDVTQVPMARISHISRRSLPGDGAHGPSPLRTLQHSPVMGGPSLAASPNTSSPTIAGAGGHLAVAGIGDQSARYAQSRQQQQQQQQVFQVRAPIPLAQQQPHAQLPQPQPPHPQLLHLHTFFQLHGLLQGINTIVQQYEQNTTHEFRGEKGRLSLLREAVHKNDYFYIVLSQLSCLKTVDPKSLPTTMAMIPPDAWTYLDALLCPNAGLDANLVRWFADFPRPIMQIYSAPYQGQAYEALVRQVVGFLTCLPHQWDNLVAISRKWQAPPLVQDLVERLQLISPVLQTTAFRAIARSFWGNSADVEAGIEALVAVHLYDQRTFRTTPKRSTADKMKTMHGYRIILNAWLVYKRTGMAAAGQRFLTPPEAWLAFGYDPRAALGVTLQAPAARQQVPPHEQVPTQRRGPAVHQRQLSQQVQTATTPIARTLISASDPRLTLAPTPAAYALVIPQQQPHHRTVSLDPTAMPVFPCNAKALFPRLADCPRAQPTHPDTTRAALHQAHLRSPTPGFANLQPDAPKLYRHVRVCALSPERINAAQPIQSWVFSPGAEMQKVPPIRTNPAYPGQPTRLLKEGSVTFHLRCCRIDPLVGFPNLSSWVTSDCYWPETLYFDLNGQPLEPRRKLQHGRFLPVDLTECMFDGENKLTVLVNRTSDDATPFDFAVAVELVDTIGHQQLVDGIKTIPAEESLASIRESLSNKPNPSSADNNDEDDDIVMTSSTLSLNLFDPISAAQIFALPVRGAQCLHRDPFDLETFLLTRKRVKAGYPAAADDWRCPICRGDVRPEELRIDGFLVQVREQLELMGLLTTRAIVVNADGSWVIKGEERTGVRSASLEREESAVARERKEKKGEKIKQAVVVIELD